MMHHSVAEILFIDVGRRLGFPQARLPIEVGTARRFSTATEKSLVADLRTILTPAYAARAREVATRMTEPAKSAAAAADLLENFARSGRVN